jgi:hypothetical protein
MESEEGQRKGHIQRKTQSITVKQADSTAGAYQPKTVVDPPLALRIKIYNYYLNDVDPDGVVYGHLLRLPRYEMIVALFTPWTRSTLRLVASDFLCIARGRSFTPNS